MSFSHLEEQNWISTRSYDSKRRNAIRQVLFSQSKFENDLIFDFFRHEIFLLFLTVHFCFRTFGFNSRSACNLKLFRTAGNIQVEEVILRFFVPNLPAPTPHLTPPPPTTSLIPHLPPPSTYLSAHIQTTPCTTQRTS